MNTPVSLKRQFSPLVDVDDFLIDSILETEEKVPTKISFNKRIQKQNLKLIFSTKADDCSTPSEKESDDIFELRMRISDFQIVKLLGKGGFSEVFQAVEKSTGQVYAIKKQLKNHNKQIKRAENLENFIKREFKLMQKVKSEFVPKVKYAFQDDQAYYYVMKMLKEDISSYLKDFIKIASSKDCEDNQKLSEALQFLTASVIQALDDIHKSEIIHKDIKPQNILFDDVGYIYVTDFGVSQEISQNASKGGTLGYMAPEVMNRAKVGVQSDFFSLGVILHKFITGRIPYQGTETHDYLDKMNKQQVQIQYSQLDQTKFTKTLVDFANQLLITDPKKRLGANGIKELKNHNYFNHFPWEALQNKEILSPVYDIFPSNMIEQEPICQELMLVRQ